MKLSTQAHLHRMQDVSLDKTRQDKTRHASDVWRNRAVLTDICYSRTHHTVLGHEGALLV